MAAPPRPAVATPATIALTPTDVRLLDAPPILALLRLRGTVRTDAVRRAVGQHAPRRFAATVVSGAHGAGPALQGGADAVRASGAGSVPVTAVDVAPGGIDVRLGQNVPVHELAAIGLDERPARDPLCAVAHVRDATGDALAVRLSHAAGDGISLLRMLGAIAGDLADDGADGGSRPSATDAPSSVPVVPSAPPQDRWLSVLALSDDCRAEIGDLAAADVGVSPTVCRMAVVARRLAPLVRPGADGLRIRIPVDLRHRGLGIPAAAVGNHWFDALAVFSGDTDRLPPAAEVARTIDAAIRNRLALLGPEDVDHRMEESLRLTRDVPGEPLRRGVDLVHSSLPTPAWPGVRALHVLGSATLGVVDQRGCDRVDLVTPRPLPPGVTAV